MVSKVVTPVQWTACPRAEIQSLQSILRKMNSKRVPLMNRVKARLDHFAFWTESSGRRIRSFSVVLYCVDIRFLIIERYNQSISRRIFSLDSSLKLLVTSYDQFRVKVRPGYFRNASIKNILYYKTIDSLLAIFPPIYTYISQTTVSSALIRVNEYFRETRLKFILIENRSSTILANKKWGGGETSVCQDAKQTARYPQVATTRQISKRGVTRVRAMFARPV